MSEHKLESIIDYIETLENCFSQIDSIMSHFQYLQGLDVQANFNSFCYFLDLKDFIPVIEELFIKDNMICVIDLNNHLYHQINQDTFNFILNKFLKFLPENLTFHRKETELW